MVEKNRNKDAPTFANINLFGKCNVDCFFCLGKDMTKEISKHNQLHQHFDYWPNLEGFLHSCKDANTDKIYITGQNTDSLLYDYLSELIDYLHVEKFKVGLRTNGYLALKQMNTINRCELSTGYSIHSLNPTNNAFIMGTRKLPDCDKIIPQTKNCRVSIVLNKVNMLEFPQVLHYISSFDNVRYIQVRRVSTDTRCKKLSADQRAYDIVYNKIKSELKPTRLFYGAEVYRIYDKDVVFWSTVETDINSFNYFTDGTISKKYFIVEGYLEEQK